MSDDARQLLAGALALPALERAAIAETLLTSLDRPDPTLDELWAREAEARIAAFEAGAMDAIPFEELFAEIEPQ